MNDTERTIARGRVLHDYVLIAIEREEESKGGIAYAPGAQPVKRAEVIGVGRGVEDITVGECVLMMPAAPLFVVEGTRLRLVKASQCLMIDPTGEARVGASEKAKLEMPKPKRGMAALGELEQE